MSAQNGWCQDEEKCVQDNMDLVRAVIYGKAGSRRHYANWAKKHQLTQDDLEPYGEWALRIAWERFDPDRGTQFSTYAVDIIEQKLTEGIVATDPNQESREAYRRRRSTLDAEARLTTTLQRVPTDEEVAFEADLPLEEVVEVRAYSYVDSLDKTLVDDGEDTLADFVEGGDMDEAVEQRESKRQAHVARNEFARSLESVDLSAIEELVLRLRWGFDQQRMEPRPRLKVAQLLAEEHGHADFVVTGEKRAKSGLPPKYLTDPVRRIELRATHKVAEHVARLEAQGLLPTTD
jgi:DNA-directed RNA polymerase specialized sigma subunit